VPSYDLPGRPSLRTCPGGAQTGRSNAFVARITCYPASIALSADADKRSPRRKTPCAAHDCGHSNSAGRESPRFNGDAHHAVGVGPEMLSPGECLRDTGWVSDRQGICTRPLETKGNASGRSSAARSFVSFADLRAFAVQTLSHTTCRFGECPGAGQVGGQPAGAAGHPWWVVPETRETRTMGTVIPQTKYEVLVQMLLFDAQAPVRVEQVERVHVPVHAGDNALDHVSVWVGQHEPGVFV
jgi:hypothetical protein